MDTELFTMIKTFQCSSNNNISFEKLYIKFLPLLKRYGYLLGYENAYQDLGIVLYKSCIKMPLHKLNFKQDKYIYSYIKKSVYNEYMVLKKQNKLEIYFYNDTCFSIINQNDNINFNLLLIDLLKLLNDSEKNLFILRFLEGYSDYEIAIKYNVSRQIINKRVRHIKNLIKKYILES